MEWDEESSGCSDASEPIDVSGVAHLSVNDAGEALYLEYRKAKRRFRGFSKSGSRKGKGRGIRRKKGSGKGKGKAMFYADGTPVENTGMEGEPEDGVVFEAYYKGGKGKGGKGSGKGRTNPIGPDGKVMKCSLCGSETHFY
jgi:hypothetical protein